MNALARFLAIYLLVVFVDAMLGWGVYRRLVLGATAGYCRVTNRTAFERFDCANRIFHSRALWMAIASAMGLAGGYVTFQALKTRKW